MNPATRNFMNIFFQFIKNVNSFVKDAISNTKFIKLLTDVVGEK